MNDAGYFGASRSSMKFVDRDLGVLDRDADVGQLLLDERVRRRAEQRRAWASTASKPSSSPASARSSFAFSGS